VSHDSSRSSASRHEPNTDAIVGILQRELMLPCEPDVAARHLEMMFLELEWEYVDEGSAVSRASRSRRRAQAIVSTCVLATALSLSGGLAAAGALPASAQHWLHRVSRAVGLDLADAPAHASGPAQSDHLPGGDGSPAPGPIGRQDNPGAPHRELLPPVGATPIAATNIAPVASRPTRPAVDHSRPVKVTTPITRPPMTRPPTTTTPTTTTPPTTGPPTPGPGPRGTNPANGNDKSRRPAVPVGNANAGAGNARPDNSKAASVSDRSKAPAVPRAPRN
jgi:hypothetical protein